MVYAALHDVDAKVSANISLSAYFADLQISVPKPPAIIALLPLFRDNAHSSAKHGMDIIGQNFILTPFEGDK